MSDSDEGPTPSSTRPAAAPPWAALPRGARDLLPRDCRRRRALTATLLQTFEAWGYEPVATPAVEYFEVIARGLSEADRRGCVRFIDADSGELVSLRADVTPQVARMLAQRWGGELPSDRVYRWSYAAEVLRQPTEAREQTEVHQVGIELVGDGDPAADAELVALVDASLRAAGLERFRIDLAHTAIARGLLDGLGLPPAEQGQARALLARKDRAGLAALLRQHDTSPRRGEALVALCDLFGPPQVVLPRATEVLAGTGVQSHLIELGAMLEHLPALAPGMEARLVLDLGEARGFDYYSGMRVRGWAPGVHHPVARGGRYDGMPRRYGVPCPATGFAVDLDALEIALAEQGGPDAGIEAPPGHLVAIDPGAGGAAVRGRAHRLVQRAREQGRRAWVQPAVALARAQALAEATGADRLTFLDEQGAHAWARGPQGWTQTEETQ